LFQILRKPSIMGLFAKTQLFFNKKFFYIITFLATLVLVLLCIDLNSIRLTNFSVYICQYNDSFRFPIERNITFSQNVKNVTETTFTTATTTSTTNQSQSTVSSTISVINLMLFHLFIRFIIIYKILSFPNR